MFGDLDAQVDTFTRFVAEVHDGRQPFPWQTALVRRILRDERWPDAIDVPTGLGKTATLDIAVFTAAIGSPAGRRRVFFVVDRRIVVDEAHEHALRLSAALTTPTGPVSAQIAAALRQLGDDADSALSVTRMRGGVTWDRVWLERPDRHAIITGTVDQIGSRLLFRGYGVAAAARPIDAALVGTDSLILVDEAHLSEPFLATLQAATGFDSARVVPPPTLVTLSATSRAPGLAHGISSDDETHPIAGRRLAAAKELHLVEVSATKAKAATAVPAAIAALARRLGESGGVVGVVINTVSRARAVFDILRTDPARDVALMTGRSRDPDRELLMTQYYPQIKAGRARTGTKPLIVVATQTVEVGANIDFDALITESAALPAVIQRLGRLNRLGDHSGPQPAQAIVVHDGTIDDKDPVYGPARLATWQWLSAQAHVHSYQTQLDPAELSGGLPVSPAALRTLASHAPADVQPPTAYTPVLLPSILDSWTRTAPVPHPDTPVAPYLHGIDTSTAPVTVIWRSGLYNQPAQQWSEIIDRLPLTTAEGIEVPYTAARRWLQTATADPLMTDVEGAADTPPPEDERSTPPNRRVDASGQPLVLIYPGGDNTKPEPVPASAIRPGTTIVVPCEYGGCDRYGWRPESAELVLDIADLAPRGRSTLLRVGATLVALAASDHAAAATPAFTDAIRALRRQAAQDIQTWQTPSAARYRPLLRDLHRFGPGPQTPLGRVFERLTGTVHVLPWTPLYEDLQTPDDHRPWDLLITTSGSTLADDTFAGSCAAGSPLGLAAHQKAVADRADQFARNHHLPEHLIAAVRAAGAWHDEGKRDPRFQTMLLGGSAEEAEIADEPLAKSGIDPADRRAFRDAWQRSGYPAGLRHEELSERIASLYLADAGLPDGALIRHLIASHHGHARPLLPPTTDPSPVKVAIDGFAPVPSHAPTDWTAVDRFVDLNHAYGRWGLALLECIVRLADIWASARNEAGEA